jgi:hypothetical protein
MKRKRRVYLEDSHILSKTNHESKKLMEWYYDQIVRSREDTEIIERFEEVDKKCKEIDDGFYLLKDICSVFEWDKVAHKEERKNIAELQRFLAMSFDISSSDIDHILFNCIRKALAKDYSNAMDLFLTNRDVKISKKLRKREAAISDNKEIPESKGKAKKGKYATEDERIQAKRERARLRRERRRNKTSS